MELTNSEKNGYTVIEFDGSLDTVSSPAAEKEINTLIDNGTLKFVFNFEKFVFILLFNYLSRCANKPKKTLIL